MNISTSLEFLSACAYVTNHIVKSAKKWCFETPVFAWNLIIILITEVIRTKENELELVDNNCLGSLSTDC